MLVKSNCSDPRAAYDMPTCDCGAPEEGACFYGATCESKIACPEDALGFKANSCSPFVRTGRGSVQAASVCSIAVSTPALCTVGNTKVSATVGPTDAEAQMQARARAEAEAAAAQGGNLEAGGDAANDGDTANSSATTGGFAGVALLVLAAAVIIAAVIVRKKDNTVDEREKGERALLATGSDLERDAGGDASVRRDSLTTYETLGEYRLSNGIDTGALKQPVYSTPGEATRAADEIDLYDVIGAGGGAPAPAADDDALYDTAMHELLNFAKQGGSSEALSQALYDVGGAPQALYDMSGSAQALYDIGANLEYGADVDQPLYSVGTTGAEDRSAASDTAASLAGPASSENNTAVGMPTYDVGGSLASAPALYTIGNAAEAETEDLYSTADGIYDAGFAADADAEPYPLFQSARLAAFGNAGIGVDLGGEANPHVSLAVGQPDATNYDLATTEEMLSFDEATLEMMDRLIGVGTDHAASGTGGDAQFQAKSFRLNDGSNSVSLMSVRRVNPLYKGSVRAKHTKSIVSSDGTEAC